MVDTLSGNLTVNIDTTSGISTDLGNTTRRIQGAEDIPLQFGVGDNQADEHFAETISLVGALQDIDLFGTKENAFGQTINMETIVAISIQNKSTVTGEDLIIGGAVANEFLDWVGATGDKIIVHAGGTLFIASPLEAYLAGAAASDIRLDPGANTFNVDLIVYGRTS